MGNLNDSQLAPINLAINQFAQQSKRNMKFLLTFKEQVMKMEDNFDSGWGSNKRLNSFFFDYEKDCLSDYLMSLNH